MRFLVSYFAEIHHDTEETKEDTAKRPFLVEQIDRVLSNFIAVFFFQLAPFKSEIQIMIFLDLTLREIGKSDFLLSRPL